MPNPSPRSRIVTLAVLIVVAAGIEARAQLGPGVAGVSAINRSMGGAAVAAPLDASGSLFWNPATISGLGRSEMGFGTELIIPRTTITSRIDAGTLGAGLPTRTLSGVTGGNNGVFPLPAFGLVYQPDKSPFTYGFGLFDLGGFGVSYPASTTNPVLTPQFPRGYGVGPLFSQYQAFQLSPTMAMKLTDEIAIGVQANLDLAYLTASPAIFAPPSPVQGPFGLGPVYADASHDRSRVGGGFQVGAYYTPTDSDWNFGASFKSPQWFETSTFPTVTPAGRPSQVKTDLDFPMIASVGTAYHGIDRLLVALDLRYVGFRETNGYRHTGFDAEGALRGLGFQDIFAVALGAQYQLTERWSARSGYTFNMNPIGNAVTTYNLASPLNIQHSLAMGLTCAVTKTFKITAGYVHYFQNVNNGPIVEPGLGLVPRSSVRTASAGDSLLIGANVTF